METTCQNHASYRFTWPGREESFICSEHVSKLQAVAQAMTGLRLLIIQLEPEEKEILWCSQKVKVTPEPTSQ